MAAENQHLSKKVKYFGKKPHFLFSERQMTHSVCMFVFLAWFALNCIDLWPQFWHFFLHQNGSNVKNWPPINTHQAPLGSGISTRDGIFSNDNDQSNIIIDRYHTFTFCLLVQEFPLKRRTFDRLFEYLSRSLCSETETTFKTFFCKCHFSFYFCKCHFSLVGIEFMPPEEKRG